MNEQGWVDRCKNALQKYTDAKGSLAEMEAWFLENKEKLVFDEQKKEFLVE